MSKLRKTYLTHHGHGELKTSRYVLLILVMVAWLALGAYFWTVAKWPSSCQPETFFKVLSCSLRLPETRHWQEAALLTWLWGTPILIFLELSRRYSENKE